MLIKIPRVGMQLMIKYPTYAHPPLGLDIDRCNYMQGFFVFSCNDTYTTKYQQHVIVGPLINMYILNSNNFNEKLLTKLVK